MHILKMAAKVRVYVSILAALCMTLFLGTTFAAPPAQARSVTYDLDIPAQSLKDSLQALALASQHKLLYSSELVDGKRSPALKGQFTTEQAVKALLSGTKLSYEITSDGLVLIRASGPPNGTNTAAPFTDDGADHRTQLAQANPAASSTSSSSAATTVNPSAPNREAPSDTGSEKSTLTEIIVTATKRAERLQDVPMAASVITGSQMMATHATTLQDVVNATPGLQLIGDSPVTNELVIRGISVGAGINTSVATYVDEVPYTADGPFALGASSAANFDTYDLAQIEVLRGPQGTLYGANALGGLLKYVTNAPDPSGYSASFLTGVNSVDHSGQTGWETHGMVNLPLGNDAALRIVGNDTYFPGYIDDPSRGAKDINDIRRDGARASFLWEPTRDFSIRLSANYQKLTAGDFGTEDVSAATLQPIFGDLTQERDLPQPLSETNQIYNVTINWNLGFGSLVSSTSYSETKTTIQADETAEVGAFTPIFFGRSLGAAATVIDPVQIFTQEVRLSSPNNQKWEWTAGLFFDHQSAADNQAVVPADLTTGQLLNNLSPLSTANAATTYREYAGFGDLTYHFTSAFEVTAGGRFSSNNQTFHEVTGGLLTALTGGAEDLHTNSSQSVFTYSVDTKYRFNPETMAYARIATGFVPGGPNDAAPGVTVPATFRSSTTTNYEVGVKGSAAEGRFSYDFDVFDVEWQHIQLNQIVDNFQSVTNGGAARSDGVEGGVGFIPVQGLTLSLNGAYTNARLTQNTPASFGGLAGDRLPLSPYFAGTTAISYERPLWTDVSGFAGLEWHYNGGRLSEFEMGLPRQELPAYSLVDLHAGLSFHHFTLTAYVKNVGDVQAISSVGQESLPLQGERALTASILPPRTIGLTLGAQF
jgi:iron complex outermembrane receptor protein